MFDAIGRHGVTHLAIPPANLGLMLPELPVNAPAFPSVRQLRLVGSTPTRAIVEAVRRKMTPNVYLPYGLGELGLVSMATPEMPAMFMHRSRSSPLNLVPRFLLSR